MIRTSIALLILALTALGISCSSSDISEEPQSTSQEPSSGSHAFQELYEKGVDRHLGTIKPNSSVITGLGVTQHLFSGIDGPVCFTGNEFSMFTRNGRSNNLMIFLQGGGFCGPDICEALETGIPLIPYGILNPSDPENPVANFNLGYIPYCDGTAMAGDIEIDSDEDGVNDRFFKGVVNLSASLDVIYQTYASPDKIVLAGNSAGGFAVHFALPLVRKLYPDTQIFVINDSGVGLANPGGFASLMDYWNAGAFLPASCTDCIGADGNFTGLHNYQLDQDKNIKMAYISSKQDSVTSIALGGVAHESQLLDAVAELTNAHPQRFQSLIDKGDAHTYIIRNFNMEIGGVTVRQWLADMINENDQWRTIIE